MGWGANRQLQEKDTYPSWGEKMRVGRAGSGEKWPKRWTPNLEFNMVSGKDQQICFICITGGPSQKFGSVNGGTGS